MKHFTNIVIYLVCFMVFPRLIIGQLPYAHHNQYGLTVNGDMFQQQQQLPIHQQQQQQLCLHQLNQVEILPTNLQFSQPTNQLFSLLFNHE